MKQSDHDLVDEDDIAPLSALLTTSSSESSLPSTQYCSSPLPNPIPYCSPASSPPAPSDSDNVPIPAPDIASSEREVEQLNTRFDRTLKSSDIHNETAGLLTEMKSAIVMMGATLFSSTGGHWIDVADVCRVRSTANWLILKLRQAQAAVQREIDAVESVLQLAPFTMKPRSEDLWTNYKQMAELVVRHTTIPSTSELELCHQLCHIYDVCVYRRRLANAQTRGDDMLIQLLDNLYDTMMTLPTVYKKWMMAMRRVGDDFTKPTMQRILHSPGVVKDIVGFEEQKEAAVKTVQEMELAARPTVATFKVKNRQSEQQLWKHQSSSVLDGHT